MDCNCQIPTGKEILGRAEPRETSSKLLELVARMFAEVHLQTWIFFDFGAMSGRIGRKNNLKDTSIVLLFEELLGHASISCGVERLG